jgi:hypothetical protein
MYIKWLLHTVAVCMFTIYWHNICCLCLYNITAPQQWLQQVTKTKQKLNFEEQLEIKLEHTNYIFWKKKILHFFGSSLKSPPSELADPEKSFDHL